MDSDSLNSNDVFVLKLPRNNGYTWIGRGASEEEEKGAEYLRSVLKCQTTKIPEGQEPGMCPTAQPEGAPEAVVGKGQASLPQEISRWGSVEFIQSR